LSTDGKLLVWNAG